MIANAVDKTKTISDPNAEYETLKSSWDISRAIIGGQSSTRDYDTIVSLSNLLIPFSPSMSQEQYDFYKLEGELPGISKQFLATLMGGLLRKKPLLTLPDSLSEDVKSWILNNFTQNNSSLSAFLNITLKEELTTSRAWIYIDYPINSDGEERDLEPYPILWEADGIINWRINEGGKLVQVIRRGYVETFSEGEEESFHPQFIDTCWVHELNEIGQYQIRTFQRWDPTLSVPVISGKVYKNPDKQIMKLMDTNQNIIKGGERLKEIPVFPLNGNVIAIIPALMPFINKEIALYNKVSRRNHLLLGAATYTPIVHSDMSDPDFDKIVGAGLGSWLHVGMEDKVDILKTPTEALKDMDRAIENGYEELAKLGIRMLSPEINQSGIALEIRAAAQTASIGLLANQVESTMQSVIALMINWRYNLDLIPSDIEFTLSEDLNPLPIGQEYLKLVTSWYESGLIPRSVFLNIAKANDIIPSDYNDEEGIKEITADEIIQSGTEKEPKFEE